MLGFLSSLAVNLESSNSKPLNPPILESNQIVLAQNFERRDSYKFETVAIRFKRQGEIFNCTAFIARNETRDVDDLLFTSGHCTFEEGIEIHTKKGIITLDSRQYNYVKDGNSDIGIISNGTTSSKLISLRYFRDYLNRLNKKSGVRIEGYTHKDSSERLGYSQKLNKVTGISLGYKNNLLIFYTSDSNLDHLTSGGSGTILFRFENGTDNVDEINIHSATHNQLCKDLKQSITNGDYLDCVDTLISVIGLNSTRNLMILAVGKKAKQYNIRDYNSIPNKDKVAFLKIVDKAFKNGNIKEASPLNAQQIDRFIDHLSE